MKNGKLLILMILVVLSFQAEAQRGVFVHDSYNSVRKYIHPLRLSHAQAADWSALNRHFDQKIYVVRQDRYLSPRMKHRKLDRLHRSKDHRLRNILSRRQYDKFRHMKTRRNRDRVRDRDRVRYGDDRGSSYQNNSNYYDGGGSSCSTGGGYYGNW